MGINVLSEFDGMSCGQLALQRASVQVDNYFASEIDKYAIKVTQTRFPNTAQLGDVTKWRKWDLPRIDLLIAGSPCQGFSNAGKGLNFQDERSRLFFEFADSLAFFKSKNPNLKFMLENVKMKKEWQDIISEILGVRPVQINAALVSAQNRVRLFWANWEFGQPEDRGIFLKDIIEDGDVDREKSYAVDANYFKGGNPRSYFEDGRRQLVFQGAALRNQVTKRGVEAQLNVRKDEKSNCVVPSYTHKLNGMIQVGVAEDINGYDIVKRIYSASGKSPTLTNMQGGHRQPKIAVGELHYRKLTVLECERLQTLPDGYTDAEISNTQRYKMIGNGWCVDVVSNIFSNLPVAFLQTGG